MLLSDKSIDKIKSDFNRLTEPLIKKNIGLDGCIATLNEYVQGYDAKRLNLHAGNWFLYRARPNLTTDFFKSTDDLWAPPRGASKGRVNDIGESELYCSDHVITCLAEMRDLKAGDHVTFMTMIPIKDINNVSFVCADQLIEFDNILSGLFTSYSKRDVNHPDFEKFQFIDETMTKEFQLKVNDGDEYLYNLTIAWRKLCFKYSKSICLVYPSARSGLHTANFALDPDIAKGLLKPIEASRMKIEWTDGTRYDIRIDAKADLNGFGVLDWKEIDDPKLECITHERVSANPFEIPHSN